MILYLFRFIQQILGNQFFTLLHAYFLFSVMIFWVLYPIQWFQH